MESEEYKRPSHRDFMTSSELRNDAFSGTRINSISGELELWVLGELRGSVGLNDVEGVTKMYEKVFALTAVEMQSVSSN